MAYFRGGYVESQSPNFPFPTPTRTPPRRPTPQSGPESEFPPRATTVDVTDSRSTSDPSTLTYTGPDVRIKQGPHSGRGR